MPSLRIKHHETSAPGRSPPDATLLTRAGEILASPLGILLAIPGLSAVLGLTLTWFADYALRGSNLEVARERLHEQAVLVSKAIASAAGQADPLLDRLAQLARAHSSQANFDDFAQRLFDLMRARPGVAYMSVSFPDGTLQGVYLDDKDELRFQDSRIVQGATRVRRYRSDGSDTLTQVEEYRNSYDPRQREFYQIAARNLDRVWTEPYTFYENHATGITRTQAVRVEGPQGEQLHAVLTVDFDLAALSTRLKAQQLEGVRAVLFTRQGAVLATSSWPGGRTNNEDHVITFRDLNDAVAQAFAAKLAAHEGELDDLNELAASGERYLSVIVPVAELPALGWSVAYFAPEAIFLKGLYTYERVGIALSLSAVAVSMLVGFLFARHVTRARREIAQAKSDVQRAQKQVRELGSYRLTQRLGVGGMGEVWRAEHRLLAREAAIKLITPGQNEVVHEQLKQRFKLEAEALSALRSRNTIELFDYGVTDDGTFFFVMELLDGVDLETLVMRHGRLLPARAISLLVQACASLAEAHDAGLIHRDIKPANIFVCRAADEVDVVKVLDFGLVRVAASDLPATAPALSSAPVALPFTGGGDAKLTLAAGGGMLGTPGFMPPEQALGEGVDARADIYALGCVAYWMLTGELVFERADINAMILATLQDQPEFSAFAPNVPRALTALIASCLAKAPADRPASARDLARELRAVELGPAPGWDAEAAQAFWHEHLPRKRRPEARQAVATERESLGEARTLIHASEADAR